jgi:hypothetical protein
MRTTSKNRLTVIAWLVSALLTVVMYVLYYTFRPDGYEAPFSPREVVNWIW